MSEKKVLVFSEGKGEIGAQTDPLDPNEQSLPALPCLIHRLTGELPTTRYLCRKSQLLVRLHARSRADRRRTPQPRARDARTAIAARFVAQSEGCVAAAIVIDHDQHDGAVRLDNLKSGRDDPGWQGYPPLALGQAIQTFDAWMICDGTAIGQAGGDDSRSHTEPENLQGRKGTDNHPKCRAAAIFGCDPNGTGLAAKYPIVARHIDLQLLKRCCPQGFAPFADEVAQHIAPVVA